MSQTVTTLAASAASVALIHTLIGVDHYLPFVALGRAGGWSLKKTLFWTGICGLGHMLSSIALALLAGTLGWAVGSIKGIDAVRGDAAAYLLVGCGLGYAIWGLVWRRHGHSHSHDVQDSESHEKSATGKSATEKSATGKSATEKSATEKSATEKSAVGARTVTLWALFVIFVLGPCEPLIPLMIAPALSHDIVAAIAVVCLFSIITIGTMLVMVTIGTLGVARLRFAALERWAHPLAGAAIAVSGGLILLGL